jgi:hypothetical protein
MNMCKFSGPNDIGYRRVSQFITEFIYAAPSVVALEVLQNNSFYTTSLVSDEPSEIMRPHLGMRLLEGNVGNSSRRESTGQREGTTIEEAN